MVTFIILTDLQFLVCLIIYYIQISQAVNYSNVDFLFAILIYRCIPKNQKIFLDVRGRGGGRKKLHDLRLLGDKKKLLINPKKSFNERWRVSIGCINSHRY